MSRKYNPVIRHADSFRTEVVVKINKRLEEMYAEQNINREEKQIVVSMKGKTDSENSEYLAKTYGRIKRKRINNRVDPDSYGLGQKVGNRISLDKQIN